MSDDGVFVMIAHDPDGLNRGGAVTPRWRLDENEELTVVMTATWPHPARVAAVTLSFVHPAMRVVKDLGRVQFTKPERTRIPGDSIKCDLTLRVSSIDGWRTGR